MEITPEEVIKRVRAAGGRLSLKGIDEEELAAWRHASKVAYLRLLRAGHERLHRSSKPGSLNLYLERVDEKQPEPDPEELAARMREWAPKPVLPRTTEFLGRVVPVPSRVTSVHPLVEQLVDGLHVSDRMTYGPDYSWRAPRRQYPLVKMRRIWQAIVNEAEFRGYSVHFEREARYYDHGKLVVRIGRDDFPLSLYGTRGKPLTLRMTERHPHRRRGYDSWTGSDDDPLHKKLGEVFTFIERWADLLVQQREAERRRELEARRRREQAEAEARREFAEDHRRKVIARRLAEAQFAEDARAYGAALLAAAVELDGPRAEQVRAWAQWVFEHADRVDPRRTLAGTPETPKPTHDELRQYLPSAGY
ncbi:hypothetical protein ACN27G_01100 [Plantactinospora sp. WMMB334]|uniref:hypothetical protein n=1 Tax=Plantactinospora sp. WMMB334 TaxID=3404119 RepID=UPI003B94D3C6